MRGTSVPAVDESAKEWCMGAENLMLDFWCGQSEKKLAKRSSPKQKPTNSNQAKRTVRQWV